MQEAIQALYRYAMENRVPRYLASQEYDAYCTAVERSEKRLLEELSDDKKKQLEKYSTILAISAPQSWRRRSWPVSPSAWSSPAYSASCSAPTSPHISR